MRQHTQQLQLPYPNVMFDDAANPQVQALLYTVTLLPLDVNGDAKAVHLAVVLTIIQHYMLQLDVPSLLLQFHDDGGNHEQPYVNQTHYNHIIIIQSQGS